RDVAHNLGQQLAERSFANRSMERGVADASADEELAARDGNSVERLDAVDVDEVRRLGQPERHRRNEALPAGQYPAVVGGVFREQRDRFVDCFWRVIAKYRGLHGAMDARSTGSSQRRRTTERIVMLLSVFCRPSPVLPSCASTISATGSKRFVSAPG